MSSPNWACRFVTVRRGERPCRMVMVVAKSRGSSAAARATRAARGAVVSPGLGAGMAGLRWVLRDSRRCVWVVTGCASQPGVTAVGCAIDHRVRGGCRGEREGAGRMAARPGWGENGGDGGGAEARLLAFAQELRAQREAAGLTQEQLAKLMGYSPSVVAKLETCRTVPSPQHARQADEALKMPGTFRRLRKATINGTYEAWVRAYLDIEERATVL